MMRFAAIGLSVLVLAGCNKANSEVSEPVVKPVKLTEVPNVQSERYDSFIANIDATDRASLSFQVAGEVEELFIHMGSEVKQGDVLAKLDPTDYQLAYQARLAEFNLAKTAFHRAEKLHAKKLISVDTYDQHEAKYKAASASLEQAKTDLDYTQILAPFDGVVSITFSKEHQVVGANQPVLNVIDNGVMDVVFTIPVSYAEQYGLEHIESSTFHVVMDSHSGVAIPARFKEISTKPDSDTNSYSASVSIERPKSMNLLPGMTAQVKLLNETGQRYVHIADTAWVSKQDTSGELYRFDQDSQTITPIEVQLDSNGNVIAGLNSGDLIVEAGVESLLPGQQVKAWKKEGGI